MPTSLDHFRLLCSNEEQVKISSFPLTGLQGDPTHLVLSLSILSLSSMDLELICLAHSLAHLFIPFIQNALTLGVLSLIGHQILSNLLFNVKSKACWLIKSSVLDSMVLRERHKINNKRTLLALLFSVPQQWFYSKVKNPDKDKTI